MVTQPKDEQLKINAQIQASPQRKLRDATMCPPIRHSPVLRPKPVKPAADGFEAQTTKIIHPMFLRLKPPNPSDGFEDETTKPLR
jgi:hypothetical protein